MRSTVADVMTPNPVSVQRTTPFKMLVALLDEHRISALPVVDEGAIPLGIVSQADLLLKETYTDVVPIVEFRRHRAERHKAEGLVAEDVMTSPVVTVHSGASLQAAAHRMIDGHVKRLVVVDADGRLSGIVTRSDLLHVFLRPDPDIRRDILEEVIVRTLWMDAGSIDVDVQAGLVTLGGTVDRLSDIAIISRLVRGVEGVVGVAETLAFRFDDVKGMSAGWPAESLR